MSSETLTSDLGIAVSIPVGKTRYLVTHWNVAELHKLFVEKKNYIFICFVAIIWKTPL